MAQQLAVLLLNSFVALAGAFAQTLNVKYFNFSADVPDHPRFLKCARHGGHARALDAQHFSKKFLRERKMIVFRQITGAQKSAAKPGFNFVICHASG